MKKNAWLFNMARCICLAFLTFILLFFGIHIISNKISSLNTNKNDCVITDWKFVWGNSKQALDGEITEWNLSSNANSIQKPLDKFFSHQYIRLHTTLPANTEPQLLELITANNPMQVCLNDKEIYNNQYDSTIATGNRINVISIPMSYSPSELDIYMKIPFFFSLNARLTVPRSSITLSTLPNQIGLIGSGVIIIIGILLIITLFLFSLKNKGLISGIWLSFIILVTGIGAFLSQLSLHSTSLTSPWLWKAQIIILMFTAAGISFTSVNIVNGWRLSEKITVILMLIYTLLFSALGHLGSIWMVIGFPFLLIFAAIVMMLRLSDAIQNRKPYASTVVYAFLTALLCEIYDSLCLIVGWNLKGTELRYTALMLYGIIMLAVLVKKSIHINIRLAEREQQIEKDTRWVQKTVTCCAGIFTQPDISDFCIETTKAIKELLLFDRENDEENFQSDSPLRISMALLNNGSFKEIYNENQPESCNYSRIHSRAKKHKQDHILFGDHSLDMLLVSGNKLLGIIHVDGIQNGLSANLQNIIRSAYTGIAAALNSLELKLDIVKMQENVFINLAEIVEQKSSGDGEHLKVVAEMVEVICEELGIAEHEKHIVSMASMVHDIGKLAIPETIIGKKGKLTQEEFAIMQDHVIYGYNMMSKSPGEFMSAAAIIAQQHHEKYDGTGYLELQGEQIHLYARIVAIADVFDALLSERSYKTAWAPEQACQYIREQSGSHFDPKIVDVFNHCKDTLLAIKRQYS